jgi:hypothetical protein
MYDYYIRLLITNLKGGFKMDVKVVRYAIGNNVCQREFVVGSLEEMILFEAFIAEKKREGSFIEILEQFIYI